MKWGIGLLIVLVIGAAVVWKMGWLPKPAAPVAQQTATTTQQQPQQVESGLPTSQSDTSDTALAQDSTAVDSQISAMSQDSATIDSSMNDKQTTQSF